MLFIPRFNNSNTKRSNFSGVNLLRMLKEEIKNNEKQGISMIFANQFLQCSVYSKSHLDFNDHKIKGRNQQKYIEIVIKKGKICIKKLQ